MKGPLEPSGVLIVSQMTSQQPIGRPGRPKAAAEDYRLEMWGDHIRATPDPNDRTPVVRLNTWTGLSCDRPAGRYVEECPPNAYVRMSPTGEVIAETDFLGFRQVYFRREAGWSAVSTSARRLSSLADAGLNEEALASQVMLGWQIGDSTPFARVQVLPPASRYHATQCESSISVPPYRVSDANVPRSFGEAVTKAADLVRESVAATLEKEPEVVLQLTGGLDSRILLAAIPPSLRQSLEVVTLDLPGSSDTRIAAQIAGSQGMKHQILRTKSLSEVSPCEAYDAVLSAVESSNGCADPIAFATVMMAEDWDSPARMAGLGGEVARGFYYLGRPWKSEVSYRSARTLAAWRLFPNQRVSEAMLVTEFHRWARENVTNRFVARLEGYGGNLAHASDEFYLWDRMRRWAGSLDSATCLRRTTVNPMLCRSFVDHVRVVPARYKANAHFLSALLVELDAELARIPLDGRPAPIEFAGHGVRRKAMVFRQSVSKVQRKVIQRATNRVSSPGGTEVLRTMALVHLRRHPELLNGAAKSGLIQLPWLERVIRGSIEPSPSEMALLVTLAALTQPRGANSAG